MMQARIRSVRFDEKQQKVTIYTNRGRILIQAPLTDIDINIRPHKLRCISVPHEKEDKSTSIGIIPNPKRQLQSWYHTSK